MKKIVILLVVVLSTTGAYGAIGDVHDSLVDWSSSANPNGDWSYIHCDVLGHYYPVSADGQLLINQTFYGRPMWTDAYGIAPSGATLEAGAFFGPYRIAAGGPVGIRWIVPAGTSGAVSVFVSIEQIFEPARQQRILIRHNGVKVTELDAVAPPDNSACCTTKVSLGPNDAIILVSAGDTVDCIMDPYGPTGDGVTTLNMCEFAITEIAMPTLFTLTVRANPANITTVNPLGSAQHPVNVPVSISAAAYFGCQHSDGKKVYTFKNWTGPVADPSAASTTVTSSGAPVTVTANFELSSACGDACHPFPQYDFNHDCLTDLADFSTFAATWLACSTPACID